MMFVYPAIFHQEDNAYWVEFPDLPGCQSFGDTLSETMAEAQEALAAYVLTLLEQGKPLTQPSDMEAITPEDGFTSLVACTIDQYKETRAVKKTLTIPSWLNDRATAMGVNFSQVLQEALITKIQA
mgnify:FL=1